MDVCTCVRIDFTLSDLRTAKVLSGQVCTHTHINRSFVHNDSMSSRTLLIHILSHNDFVYLSHSSSSSNAVLIRVLSRLVDPNLVVGNPKGPKINM